MLKQKTVEHKKAEKQYGVPEVSGWMRHKQLIGPRIFVWCGQPGNCVISCIFIVILFYVILCQGRDTALLRDNIIRLFVYQHRLQLRSYRHEHTLNRKNTPKCLVLGLSSTKPSRFWQNLVHTVLNKLAIQ